MQQLHLVGFTTDHRGLIFSVRRGAKSGGFVVQLDEPVMTAVDELRALLAEETTTKADSNATSKRPESSLSVREVQARLRRGRTIEQVAREAGVDATWVSRFAVPVLAEQAEIIRAVRATRMTKHRVGLSAAPLGDSVYRNLAERGISDPREELDKAWRARQVADGMWLVTLKYSLRGRESEAVWEYDEAAGALRARGRLATQLGFRETGRRGPGASTTSGVAKPIKRTSKTSKAKKAAAPATARRSSSRQATKRVAVARRAATARMVSEAEKATRRNAALALKAATKPVVLAPRRVQEPSPPPEPLLVDEPGEEPKGWVDELDLAWSKDDVGFDDDGEPEPEDDVELEPDDLELELEDDVEVEVEVEVEPPRPTRRREPLRARPIRSIEKADLVVEDVPESPAERARHRVRLRSTAARNRSGADERGDGPIFRSDLAQPASQSPSFPRSSAGQSPAPPLSMPLQPIEPPSRRRRPLRGR